MATEISRSYKNCITSKLIHQSIPAAPNHLPPGYWGAFSRRVSPGVGAFASFALPGSRAFCQPLGYSRAFDTHAVSYQNITTQRILLEKKGDWLICQEQEVVKACSRFYASISSLLSKPELHSETRVRLTWINVFSLVNQISVDIIWRTSFRIHNLFMTYNFTALY